MLKNIKDNKGFTLIELLAVIVILGILMIIAIPQVTKYIENSKKDTFADTAKAYINSARYMLLNDEFANCTLPGTGSSLYIRVDIIDIEQGGEKSSYGATFNKATSWVKVQNNDDKYTYSIALSDGKSNGTSTNGDKIFGFVTETNLGRETITKGLSGVSVSTTDGTTCTSKS